VRDPGRVLRPARHAQAAAGAPVRYETVAVAWNADGRAGVFFNGGACGAGLERPGLYLVSLDGEREFVTDDVEAVEGWKAERD
jgi:hypothetical protein